MVWELLAIWAVVAAACAWFFYDERSEQRRKLNERARKFATTPAWVDRRPSPPATVTPRDPQRLTEVQRKFLEEIRRQGAESQPVR